MKKFLITFLILSFSAFSAFANEEMPTLDEEQKAILKTEIQEDIFNKDKIIEYKTFKISSVDNPKIKKRNNKLIIYTPLFGKTTNTDLKGYEAVVVNNRVIKLNQSNSYIPENGYVISGYGEAKKFITQNFFEGVDVEIDFDNSEIKVASHQENYIYEANYRFEKTKKLMQKNDVNSPVYSDMNFYLTKADDILYRAKKLVEFEDYEEAQRMANNSIIYSDMALFSSIPYLENEFRGIWIFPYQKTAEEVEQAFNIISRLNIDNIFIEGYFNGNTIYKSDVQTKYNLPEQNRSYRGFDPLQAWIDIAKKHNKNVIVAFNAFDMGNPPKSTIKNNIVNVHKDWVSKASTTNAYYLNPQNKEVNKYLLELINEVQNKYDILGISLKGLNLPDNSDVSDFVNNAIINQQDKFLSIEINHDMKNISSLMLDENIILLPQLKSPDENFAKNFLTELKNNSNNAKIYPVYFEPFNDEEPRRLFDKINVSRNLNINGIILYDLDCLNKKYYDALRLSIFQTPVTKKQNTNSFMAEIKNINSEENNEEMKEEIEDGTTIKN